VVEAAEALEDCDYGTMSWRERHESEGQTRKPGGRIMCWGDRRESERKPPKYVIWGVLETAGGSALHFVSIYGRFYSTIALQSFMQPMSRSTHMCPCTAPERDRIARSQGQEHSHPRKLPAHSFHTLSSHNMVGSKLRRMEREWWRNLTTIRSDHSP
jgi:hypothetical protein